MLYAAFGYWGIGLLTGVGLAFGLHWEGVGIWVGLAAWTLIQPAPAGAFYNLVRGWTLLLAGSFGLVCLFGTRRPFFPRALSATSLALALVLLMSTRGPLTPARAHLAVQAEFARRNTEAITMFREIGDPVGETEVLINLGDAFEQMGRYGQASDRYQEAAALAAKLGDRQLECAALNGQGRAACASQRLVAPATRQ